MGLSSTQRKIVGEIRDAVASSLDLREVLDLAYPLLMRVVPADYAAIGVTRPGDRSQFDWLVADMPPAFFEAYPLLAAHDFVLRSVVKAPNRVLRDADMIPRRALEANALYRSARDLGMPLEQVMSTMLHADADWASGISLYRTERRPFSELERGILQTLIPAFRNAVRNCRRFDEQVRRADALEELLAARRLASLILLPPAREIARTAAATELIERWFRPSERAPGGLPLALVERASTRLEARSDSSEAPWVAARRDDRELLVQEYRLLLEGTSCLALVLSEVSRAGVLPQDWPARLTPREVQVACQVVEGFDNKMIADALGVELSTLKKHITSVFTKLGLESRAQLIARARRISL